MLQYLTQFKEKSLTDSKVLWQQFSYIMVLFFYVGVHQKFLFEEHTDTPGQDDSL